MQLLLVRHPRPDIPAGYCYGRTDVPVPVAQIDLVHASLSAAGLPGGAAVYASPLQRCASLALRLDTASVSFDSRLAEMDFGAWEMCAWDDIPRDEVDAWAADLQHYRPGGGESVLDVAHRVAAFLAQLRRARHPRALVICHAGTIRLLAALHDGGPVEQAALRAAQTPHRIGYGELLVLND